MQWKVGEHHYDFSTSLPPTKKAWHKPHITDKIAIYSLFLLKCQCHLQHLKPQKHHSPLKITRPKTTNTTAYLFQKLQEIQKPYTSDSRKLWSANTLVSRLLVILKFSVWRSETCISPWHPGVEDSDCRGYYCSSLPAFIPVSLSHCNFTTSEEALVNNSGFGSKIWWSFSLNFNRRIFCIALFSTGMGIEFLNW